MITDPNHYFTQGCGRCAKFATPECNSLIWADAQAILRQLCLDVGLSEHAKWGHPCYMHADRNIALIGAFRDHIRFSFFNAALLKDPEHLLERQGKHSQSPSMLRLTSVDQIRALAPILTAYLTEAMTYADQRLTAPKTTTDFAVPPELTDALDADPALADAFAALTPGRQRGYLMHIGDAKQSKTRANRVEKLRPRIFAGKGYNER